MTFLKNMAISYEALVPKKVEGDRDRRPFWAGGENKVARRLLGAFGESLVFFSTEWSYAWNSDTT